MTSRRVLASMATLCAIVMVLLVLFRDGGLADREARAQSPSSPSSGGPTSLPAAAPTTQPASGQAAPAITLPATLIADETVELYAKASGYLAQINVDIGSHVRSGDVLLQLDSPEMLDDVKQNEAVVAARKAKVDAMQAKVTQARLAIETAAAQQKRIEAELALSRITQSRKAELFREEAIPQQEFDVSENQLAVAEADLLIAKAKVESARGEELAAQADTKSAEADLGVAEADTARLRTLLAYTTVRAPFDGVITHRQVDPGAFVRSAAQGSGPALLVLEKVDRLRLVIDIPEMYATRVLGGTTVRIQLRAQSELWINAAVTRTSSALRSDTRTMRAEIDLDNAEGRLLPGMFAKVTLQPPPQNSPGA